MLTFIAEIKESLRKSCRPTPQLPPLTPKAKLVIQRAVTMAAEHKRECGPLFLILGLLEFESDTKAVLQRAKISSAELMCEIDKRPSETRHGRAALPAETVQILTRLAPEEARTLHDRFVGTEALLLGLLRQAGPAGACLAGQGLDYLAAVRAIQRIRNRSPRTKVMWPTFAEDHHHSAAANSATKTDAETVRARRGVAGRDR